MTAAPRPALTGTPVLRTPRLVLRAPEPGDFEGFAAFLAGDRAAHVGGPAGRLTAWRAFCHITGHWVMRGWSMFVMADPATGRGLGMAGPWFPETWPEAEIGWSLWDAAAEGQGLAFEAVSALRAFVRDRLGWRTAISLIAEGNTRSEALARRLGCVPEGRHAFETGGEARIWRHVGLEDAA
jgi:RimJ/RimL family protein N-acetyltransferase